MNMQSATHYIRSFIPGRTTLEQEVLYLPSELHNTIEQFGELTLGLNNQISIFNAIKILAKTFPEVKSALSICSTPIGQLIDDTIIENNTDNWFDTILLYRPDMLISKDGHIYTNELEIVVGGICTISLLQHYLYGEYKLLSSLIAQMRRCQEKFGLNGHIAFLADRNGAAEINGFKWVPDHLGADVIVASIEQLDFKNDGVYFNNKKIAVAHVYIKAHKLREKIIEKDELLLRHWLARNIALISPPSLIMDNKLIMYFLQHPKYKLSLEQSLGTERYRKIQSYLPATYILEPEMKNSDDRLHDIIRAPWNHGRFIVKYPSLWGSRKMIASPEHASAQSEWREQLDAMLMQSGNYGPLLIQEMIDVQRIPFLDNGQAMNGITKYTPFFTHDIFQKTVTLQAMAVNVTPSGFQAHIDENSRFALVEKQ